MHTTRHRLTATHAVLPLTASFYTASCVAATPALALPRAVSDVAISVVTDPATSFVTGCATGAVIAGLLVGLMSRGTRMKLQEQLAETMDALSRAEAATHAAEQLVHEMQLEMGVLNGRPYSPFDYVGTVKLEDTEPFGNQTAESRQAGQASGAPAGARTAPDPYAQANVNEDTQAYDTARENGFAVPAEQALAREPQAAQADVRGSAPAARASQATASGASASQTGGRTAASRQGASGTGASPAHTGSHLRGGAQATQTHASAHASGRKAARGATGQSVKMRLAERYGHRANDIIIERAPRVLEDTRPHARTVQSAPTMRYFDPKKRAAAIDRRIPRLDESLYPDMSAVSSHDHDPFATAMRAMDRAMGPQQPASYAAGDAARRGAAPYQPHQPHQPYQDGSGLGASRDLGTTRSDLIAAATPMISSADEAHVDQLVAEEFALNRSGAPRRFSRSKLTMIDGGEQAGTPRRGGRHFANVS